MGKARKRKRQRRELLAEIGSVRCAHCMTEIQSLQVMDTAGIDGIEHVVAGSCPKCGRISWPSSGTPEALQRFHDLMTVTYEEHGVLPEEMDSYVDIVRK